MAKEPIDWLKPDAEEEQYLQEYRLQPPITEEELAPAKRVLQFQIRSAAIREGLARRKKRIKNGQA